MVDFINIQHLAQYLDQIYIYESFGIFNQSINKEILQDIDRNPRTDEVFKSLLEIFRKIELF